MSEEKTTCFKPGMLLTNGHEDFRKYRNTEYILLMRQHLNGVDWVGFWAPNDETDPRLDVFKKTTLEKYWEPFK